MSLDFRFQAILNLRKRTEDERQLELAQALQAVAALRAQRERLQNERLRIVEQLRETLTGFVDVSNIEQRYRYLASLDQRLHHLAEELAQADEEVLAQRGRLAEAVKDRRTMEKLKEYDRQSFLSAFQKKEQEALDDLNVSRFARQM
ncbi:MAG: flagellar export protein FliJ [Caldilineaceae bacterium]|nr:flagellar export protein FliJ [Caldilineaceae bacterium]